MKMTSSYPFSFWCFKRLGAKVFLKGVSGKKGFTWVSLLGGLWAVRGGERFNMRWPGNMLNYSWVSRYGHINFALVLAWPKTNPSCEKRAQCVQWTTWTIMSSPVQDKCIHNIEIFQNATILHSTTLLPCKNLTRSGSKKVAVDKPWRDSHLGSLSCHSCDSMWKDLRVHQTKVSSNDAPL